MSKVRGGNSSDPWHVTLVARTQPRSCIVGARTLNMKRKTLVPGALAAAIVFSIILSKPTALMAQSLMDLRVGDAPSKLSKFGPVAGLDKYKQMDVFKWVLPNRSELSATVDAEGEIVYLESDWGGKSEDTGCDLAGLKFGVTTLAELRKRFGSNGFGYK